MTDSAETKMFDGALPQEHSPRISLASQILARAALIALILGSILALANQSRAIFGPQEIAWLPLMLVYLTPFVVVGVSQVLGIRRARDDLARTSTAIEDESFPKTVAAHGIPARAIALGLALGSTNTAIVAVESLLTGRGLAAVPLALIAQALTLPALFGAVSQALAYRRYLKISRSPNGARPHSGLQLERGCA